MLVPAGVFREPPRILYFTSDQSAPPRLCLLAVSPSGSSESRIATYDFSPSLDTGDTILSATMEQLPAPDQPALTFGSPAIAGATVQVLVSIDGGQANVKYATCCNVQTAYGQAFPCFGDYLLIGPE